MAVDRVGVELEGGWENDPSRKYHEHLKYDGSVTGVAGAYIGELASKPMKLDKILLWVNKVYPDTHNKSCGLHIHVSFHNLLDYQKLMSKEFYDYFLKRVKKWGEEKDINPNTEFWIRLKGDNRYCTTGFRPEEQKTFTDHNGPRYMQLNYAWGLYKTLECRLFPMFQKKELALSAIELFVNICDEYLKKICPREHETKTNVLDDEPEMEYNEVLVVS